MSIKMRTVTVHQIPEQVNPAEERAFLRNLQPHVETERPRLVLDCSRIREMDKATIHLLLSCLEEAMKRNGDVKLAALRPGAEASLRFGGVNRLFEIHATTADAVHSFQRRRSGLIQPAFATTELGSEQAA